MMAAGMTWAGDGAQGPKPEILSTLDAQTDVELTVYHQDLALVREVRRIDLGAGENRVAIRDVSAQMRAETVVLRALDHPQGFQVMERSFDFDPLTPETLLQHYVGRRVGVVRSHPTTGAEAIEEATVLSATEGVVLRIGDRIETQVPGRLVYDRVPEHLRDRPTLLVDLHTATAGSQRLELSYLSGGLGWKADYVAEIDGRDDRLQLDVWVTLTNTSGTTFRNARLALVAGDVHRVRDQRERPPVVMRAAADTGPAKEALTQESLFEYHLYRLDRRTTLADQQTKQLSLLSEQGIPVSKGYVLKGRDYYYGGRYNQLGKRLKVGVFVVLQNTESAHLGLPLPKGIVRVYKKDSSGRLRFVGEDRIEHTPKDRELRLKLGESFDITAQRTQTDFKKLAAVGKYRYAFASSYRIVLENAKDAGVTVRVQEPIPGDWEIAQESHPHRREAAGVAEWDIPVPAQGKATLTYTAHVRY
jgi:hypothetical protein